jgi:hypothetical protein
VYIRLEFFDVRFRKVHYFQVKFCKRNNLASLPFDQVRICVDFAQNRRGGGQLRKCREMMDSSKGIGCNKYVSLGHQTNIQILRSNTIRLLESNNHKICRYQKNRPFQRPYLLCI